MHTQTPTVHTSIHTYLLYIYVCTRRNKEEKKKGTSGFRRSVEKYGEEGTRQAESTDLFQEIAREGEFRGEIRGWKMKQGKAEEREGQSEQGRGKDAHAGRRRWKRRAQKMA